MDKKMPKDKKFVTDKDLKNWDFYKTDPDGKGSTPEPQGKKPTGNPTPPRNPDHVQEKQ